MYTKSHKQSMELYRHACKQHVTKKDLGNRPPQRLCGENAKAHVQKAYNPDLADKLHVYEITQTVNGSLPAHVRATRHPKRSWEQTPTTTVWRDRESTRANGIHTHTQWATIDNISDGFRTPAPLKTFKRSPVPESCSEVLGMGGDGLRRGRQEPCVCLPQIQYKTLNIKSRRVPGSRFPSRPAGQPKDRSRSP